MHICHAISDLYPERISDNTFKKLEIILSDLKSSFNCLDSIKATLNITSVWNDVENLRRTVRISSDDVRTITQTFVYDEPSILYPWFMISCEFVASF